MTDTQTEAKPVRYRIAHKELWRVRHSEKRFSRDEAEILILMMNEAHGPGTHWLETDEES